MCSRNRQACHTVCIHPLTPSSAMDSDEVDIGTLGSAQGNPWLPQHIRLEASPRGQTRRLASSSAPNVVKGTIIPHTQQPRKSLEHTKTLPHALHQSGVVSDPHLPQMDEEKISSIRRWILAVAVGKYWSFSL